MEGWVRAHPAREVTTSLYYVVSDFPIIFDTEKSLLKSFTAQLKKNYSTNVKNVDYSQKDVLGNFASALFELFSLP